MADLACPSCFSTDRLQTIEHLTGLAPAHISIDDTGCTEAEWEGSTEVWWDSSTTVGICCRCCDFTYEGDDWATQLLRVPTVAQRIASAIAIASAPAAGAPDSAQGTPSGQGITSGSDPAAPEWALTVLSPEAAAADPRVQLLLPLVMAEGLDSTERWSPGNDVDILELVTEYLPGFVEGTLAPAAEVAAALQHLDGSTASAVSLLTGLSTAELDGLGGFPER
jgi:hypothetical protein